MCWKWEYFFFFILIKGKIRFKKKKMEGGCYKAFWFLFEILGILEEIEVGNRIFGGRGGVSL